LRIRRLYIIIILLIAIAGCATHPTLVPVCRHQVLEAAGIAIENHWDYKIAVYLVESHFTFPGSAHAQLLVRPKSEWKWLERGLDGYSFSNEPEFQPRQGWMILTMTLEEYVRFLEDYRDLQSGKDGKYHKAYRGDLR